MIRRLWYLSGAAVLVLICGLGIAMGVNDINEAEAQLEQVRQANWRMDRENRSLYRTIQNLRQDPDALEKLCRSELGLVRANEIIYLDPQD
jgi:cell division protein FtsB